MNTATVRTTTTPWRDATLIYVVMVGIATAGDIVWAHDPPHAPVLRYALAFGPLLLTLAIVLALRRAGHPAFPLGSPLVAVRKVWWLWVIGLAIALASAIVQHAFARSAFGLADFLIAAVVLAPITEELAFRGAIQTALNATVLGTRSFAGFRGGTLVAAVLFSCSHLALLAGGVAAPSVAFEVVSSLPLALIAGYVYQRTGNIWYGVILHALGNLGGA